MRTVLSLAALALAACNPPAETTTTESTTVETPAPAPAPTVIMLTEADARSRLETAGYTNVMWYRGGVAAWRQADQLMTMSDPFSWKD